VRSAEAIVEALRAAPDAAAALDVLAPIPGVWVVGGAVRDVLLGREPRELDVVVEGDPAPAVAALGGTSVAHDRFGTAIVTPPGGGRAVDVVRARAESYAAPGALPDVCPGTLDEDLARRDVTVNAIAVRVGGGPPELRTVPRAADDLAVGMLRVLHDDSFRDDPTRIWRVARYAARLGFDIDPHTRALARDADPSTVSGPRMGNELRLALRESDPLAVLRSARSLQPALLPAALDLEPAGLEAAQELLPDGGRHDLVLLAACARPMDLPTLLAWLDGLAFVAADRDVIAAGSRELLAAPLRAAGTNAEIGRAARGVPLELVALAGGEQARRWIDELRHIRLDITGDDLLAAGVKEGPELGLRLAAALDAKLDGRVNGREDELAVALAPNVDPHPR